MKILVILLVCLFFNCGKKSTKKNIVSKQPIHNKIINNSVKEINETISDIVIKKVFNELSIIKKTEDSIKLYDYTVKIEDEHKPIYLSFKKCTPFVNKEQFDEDFELLDIVEWNEEALIHKHLFYKKEEFILILDTYDDRNIFKENRCVVNVNYNEIIQRIRIYKKSDYLEVANKSMSSSFSTKIK